MAETICFLLRNKLFLTGKQNVSRWETCWKQYLEDPLARYRMSEYYHLV